MAPQKHYRGDRNEIWDKSLSDLSYMGTISQFYLISFIGRIASDVKNSCHFLPAG